MSAASYYRRVGRTAVRASPVLLASFLFLMAGIQVSAGGWRGWDSFIGTAEGYALFAIPIYCTAVAIAHATVEQAEVSD